VTDVTVEVLGAGAHFVRAGDRRARFYPAAAVTVVDGPVADRLVRLGAARVVGSQVDEPVVSDALAGMTVAQLRGFAKEHGIAIPADVTSKDAIRAHLASQTADRE
jgi:hypothetical protein